VAKKKVERDVPAERPVRAGVFDTVAEAERAVENLLAEGFPTERISVVCSDEAKERHFAEFLHDAPAGTTTPVTAARGGVIGGLAGGALGVAGVALTGGIGLIAVGPLLIGTVFGTFVGAMVSRGLEHEVANYYDQALRRGQILVAAEIGPDDDPALLARAERVLSREGSRTVSLPEG
jgi:hypothetical protein